MSRVLMLGLFCVCLIGCGQSTDPVIPENPTESAPEIGPGANGIETPAMAPQS